MEKYPQTVEKDDQMLRDHSLSRNVRNCILYTRGEKMKIQKIMRVAKKLVEICKLDLLSALKINIDCDDLMPIQ